MAWAPKEDHFLSEDQAGGSPNPWGAATRRVATNDEHHRHGFMLEGGNMR